MRNLLICSLFVITGCQTASLNSQVIKAREMVAKTTLSSWARTQQFYHLEEDKFAASNSELNFSVASSEYYDFKIRDVSSKGALMTADPKKKYEQLSGFFALAIYEDGKYSSRICELKKTFTGYSDINNLEVKNCYVY